MDRSSLSALLESSPIIAAVKDDEGLTRSLTSDCRAVFVLYGSVINIADIIDKIKAAGRAAFVHIDLIEGLSAKEAAVDFIIERTAADGVISTKQALIRHAKSRGLMTIQRFFLLDSMALSVISRQIDQVEPDFIEVLPGGLPKIILKITKMTSVPLIAGGLIEDKEDVVHALKSGAAGISSTDADVWNM